MIWKQARYTTILRCKKNIMIHRLCRILKSILHEEEAATTVEYALLLVLIAAFCISAIVSTGDVQKSLWFDTAASVQVIVP